MVPRKAVYKLPDSVTLELGGMSPSYENLEYCRVAHDE